MAGGAGSTVSVDSANRRPPSPTSLEADDVRRRGWRRTSFAFLVATLGMGACAESAEVPDADESPTWTVAADPVAIIGRLEGAPEYVLAGVRDVKLLPDGGVVLADGQSASVRTYDGSGAFVRSVGRSGEGPGEFDYVRYLFPGDDGSLEAYDAMLHRLTRFSADGAVDRTVTLRADSGLPEIYLPANGERHFGAWIDQQAEGSGPISADLWHVATFDSAGSDPRRVATFYGFRRVAFEGGSGPAPFSPRAMSVSWNGGMAFSDGVGGRIHRVDGDALTVDTIEVDLPTHDARSAYQALAPLVDSVRALRLEQVRGIPGTDSIPAFSAMLSDDLGHLWLKPYDPRTDNLWAFPTRRTGGTWLVVDDAGRSVARVAVPDDLVLMDVRGDRIAGVTYDEFGVERVRVHQLVR